MESVQSSNHTQLSVHGVSSKLVWYILYLWCNQLTCLNPVVQCKSSNPLTLSKFKKNFNKKILTSFLFI